MPKPHALGTPSRILLALLTVVWAGILLAPASSAPPKGPGPLQKAVAEGRALFSSTTLGTSGRSCESCHPNGGETAGEAPGGAAIPSLKNAAAIYPRYVERWGGVRTLEMQVNGCIAGALGGKPLAYDSQQMVALVSYLTTLADGQPIHVGGAPK